MGARPGTLAVSSSAIKPQIRVIQYDANGVRDSSQVSLEELANTHNGPGVTWIDIQGLGDETILRSIGKQFAIEDMCLEDTVNVPQRPKIMVYGDKLLWVTRMVRIDEHGLIDREQLSVVHSKNVLITFQERPGDILDPVRRRIHDETGPMRSQAADYLAYAIVDTVIDGYYPIVEKLAGSLELLEGSILQRATPENLVAINHVRLLLLTLRRGMSAQSSALRQYLTSPSIHVLEHTLTYLRDTLDHTQQLNDVMENQKELVAGLLNTYLSMVSYQTNEVTRILTIMASIFIPLTFVAGIYGMNFQHMPELSVRWAYPVVLGLMAVLALTMVVFFIRKGWLGKGKRKLHQRLTKDDSND